jgi:hypothetical protein
VPDLSDLYHILDHSSLLDVAVDVALGPPVQEQVLMGQFGLDGASTISSLPPSGGASELNDLGSHDVSPDSDLGIVGIAAPDPHHHGG